MYNQIKCKWLFLCIGFLFKTCFCTHAQKTFVINQNQAELFKVNQQNLSKGAVTVKPLGPLVNGYTVVPDTFVFKGRFHKNVYADSMVNLGLRFENGHYALKGNLLIRNQVNLQKQDSTWHDSPVISLMNADVRFYGFWKADNNYSKPVLNLMQGSHFHFEKGASMKLVFPAYGNFTRQLWVHSDGTGTLSLEKGFKADLSDSGRSCNGLGSIRLMNCKLRTTDSAGLPVYFRPEPTNPKNLQKAALNSHIVFEKAAGKSVWEVDENKQHFIGGIWVFDSVFTLNTQSDFKMTGTFARWSDYENYNGLIFANKNVCIFKKGNATLELGCATHLPSGSRLVINEGTLKLTKNPFLADHTEIHINKNAPHGNNLDLELKPNTSLNLATDTLTLFALSVHNAKIELQCNTVIQCKNLNLLGKTFINPNTFTLGIETDKNPATLGTFIIGTGRKLFAASWVKKNRIWFLAKGKPK